MADDLWGAETAGNQISTDYTRIDLLFENREVYDSQKLEDAVNDIIGSNTEVLVHDWSREKIVGHEQMRHTKFMDRIPSSIPTLRVVEVQGIDLCPCAGTHVANTDVVEPITITNVRSKGAGKFRITYQFENTLE
jgi:misacylated tRNA(Ala) deacylase